MQFNNCTARADKLWVASQPSGSAEAWWVCSIDTKTTAKWQEMAQTEATDFHV